MDSNSSNKIVINYIALYGLLYALVYLMLTAVSSIFQTYFGYATIPLIVAVFIALRYAKNNDKALTNVEKAKLIFGTFILTISVNIIFTVEVIGALRSIDYLDGDFLLRQFMQLIAISVAFGSDDFYCYLKKNY
jgi:hypothetical protein